jgi:hypothetical protein
MEYTANVGCTWTFEGSALKTINLLRYLGILKDEPSSWIAHPPIPFHDA